MRTARSSLVALAILVAACSPSPRPTTSEVPSSSAASPGPTSGASPTPAEPGELSISVTEIDQAARTVALVLVGHVETAAGEVVVDLGRVDDGASASLAGGRYRFVGETHAFGVGGMDPEVMDACEVGFRIEPGETATLELVISWDQPCSVVRDGPEASDRARTVDPTIVPVSASHPTVEAAEALALCGVSATGVVGLDDVAGMGYLERVRDAPRYVNLTGKEPEIQVDRPAWVIQLQGEIMLPRGLGTATDPTCVVIDGIHDIFMTGPVTSRGVTVQPLQPETPPDLLLPALAP